MKLVLSVMVILSVLSIANFAMAEEKTGWGHESTLGVVRVGGNSDSESYNGKQKTIYTLDSNALTVTGQYLETKTTGVQTGKAWDAAVRYERIFTAWWSSFVQHGAESDTFAGYTQRDNSDLGAKYYMIQDDNEKLFSELGYRYTKTLSSQATPTKYESYGRAYVEYACIFNASVSGKVWVEYLPNFTNSNAYLVNYEPSMTVLMNSVFSLKVAYLVKYHNLTLTPNEKKEDTTFTTALVAKF